MGNDRPFEQERNFKFDPVPDHRGAWVHKAETEPNGIGELAGLLRAYLAIHGDWREITANGEHFWEFKVCDCPLCQATSKLIDHPERPYA